MTISRQSILQQLELTARIYAALMLSIYGSGKIVGGQFYRRGKIPEEIAQTPIVDVGSFDLAWTFFGYSEYYIYFIGGSQLIGAFLLLLEKTKLLGAAVLIPILLNIIVVDICFEISYGAMTSAIVYLSAILFMLFCNREKVHQAFQTLLVRRSGKAVPFLRKFIKVIIAIGAVAILILLENQMLNIIGR